MIVTLSGISIFARLVQLPNAPPPINVTLFGIFTLLRFEQQANASTPMLVTLSGIIILLRFVQPKKQQVLYLLHHLEFLCLLSLCKYQMHQFL